MSTTYKEKLKDIRWGMKRAEILIRDNFTCQYCHVKESSAPSGPHMEVHHFDYPPLYGNPWDVPNSDLITLCSQCHDSVMRSHHREARITGRIEKERMERRRQLREQWADELVVREQYRQEEELRREQNRIEAGKCTCDSCQEERALIREGLL